MTVVLVRGSARDLALVDSLHRSRPTAIDSILCFPALVLAEFVSLKKRVLEMCWLAFGPAFSCMRHTQAGK